MILECECGLRVRAVDNEMEIETVLYCPAGCHFLVFNAHDIESHDWTEEEVVLAWKNKMAMHPTSATCAATKG